MCRHEELRVPWMRLEMAQAEFWLTQTMLINYRGSHSLVADKDEVKRLGTLARQRILDVYDFSMVGTRYYAFYDQLVNDK